LNSSIGNKVAMALSGLVMLGWLAGHLTGNLLIFAGADAMNGYAAWLHSKPAMLWVARIILLASAVLHVLTAIRLKRMNSEARPSRYHYNATVQSTLSGRTMIYSGLLVLAYAVYHLAHFTFTAEAVIPAARVEAGVWQMVVWSFSQPPVAIVYILANVLLGLHLSHGISSVFQTLGLTNAKWRPVIERTGPAVGAALAAGFISIPVAVLLGLVSL
jgi:succinate dehydrogenase / fumarate reductase cytochrome b subunit